MFKCKIFASDIKYIKKNVKQKKKIPCSFPTANSRHGSKTVFCDISTPSSNEAGDTRTCIEIFCSAGFSCCISQPLGGDIVFTSAGTCI